MEEKRGISPAALIALLGGDFENALVASTPGGIERQEAEGQTSFVAGSTLPRRMLHGCTKEILEEMGIIFGDNVDGDAGLFVNVQLPEGWSKRATDHSMWTDLLDERGRKRAGIFYKAAFYDRSAHIILECRYSIGCYVNCDADGIESEDYNSTHVKTVVRDCEEIICEVGIRESAYSNESSLLRDEHVKQAGIWLGKNFPFWENKLAYWD